MPQCIRIHPADNVAVALCPIPAGTRLSLEGRAVQMREDIPQGHKLALAQIAAGENIIKYGYPIGHAASDIPPGAWVHTHNVRTNLSGEVEYTYAPDVRPLSPVPPETFQGYRRADGRVGVRNELWIIPTVGCVNDCAKALAAENQSLVSGSIDGLYAFPHPFGCSQTGADHAQTRRLLAALARHPNAGGVLVLSLGCENLTHEQFAEELGPYDPARVKFLTCQDVEDEMEAGGALLAELAAHAGQARREAVPVCELVVGMKCGGSDGLSGITANPAVGRFSDMLCARGGSTILTEVPEMFGAETLLMDRCESEAVFRQTVSLINDFKHYFTANHQTVYENPSPGNKKGGITTLEDKSLGCTQKSGSAPVVDVLPYAHRVEKPGLNLLSAPGNDLVAATALAAAGAQIVLFSTGRGTPFACPVPTVKIASNPTLAQRKRNWIDFSAAPALEGVSIEQLGEALYRKVLAVAGGEPVKSEEAGFHDLAIFKQGVTL